MIGDQGTRTRYEVKLIRQRKVANDYVRGYETYVGIQHFAAPNDGSHGLDTVYTRSLSSHQQSYEALTPVSLHFPIVFVLLTQ